MPKPTKSYQQNSMKLTDARIRAIKPTDKVQKISDGGGLYLEVTNKGAKLWRLAYRFEGKQKLLALGSYPAVSLVDARKSQVEAKGLLARGLDPSAEKKRIKEEALQEMEIASRTFRAVGQEWYATKLNEWAATNAKKKQWLLNVLYSGVGDIPVSKLVPQDILVVVKQAEKDGHLSTARGLVETAGQVCRYARTCGYCMFNPADGLKDVIAKPERKHFATITNPADVGRLLADIDRYVGSISVMFALKILPYVALRSTELRGARWNELDLDNAIWIVPAARRERKQDGGGMKRRIAHEVPLSGQVVELFRELHKYTGHGELCFPGRQSQSQCISDMGLLNALRRLDYGRGEMTIHGFRAMFSTILNEKKQEWGINYDIIEKQLAHAEKNAVRDAYNHAGYLDERRRMMQMWADYLDELRAAAE